MDDIVKKPNLFIIGAKKCATTSLHHYLNQHPEISMSEVKELNFFTSNYKQEKLSAYLEHFQSFKTKYCGESSPQYSEKGKFPGTAERLYKFNSNAKIIYIIKDPVKRLISDYKEHKYQRMILKHDINEALNRKYTNGKNPFREGCKETMSYNTQILEYEKFFSRKNIHVTTAELLSEDPHSTLNQICEFLSIDQFQFNTRNEYNRSSDKKELAPIGVWLHNVLKINKYNRILNYFTQPISGYSLDTSKNKKYIENLYGEYESIKKRYNT